MNRAARGNPIRVFNIHRSPQAKIVFATKYVNIRVVYTRIRPFRGNKLIDRSPSWFQGEAVGAVAEVKVRETINPVTGLKQ